MASFVNACVFTAASGGTGSFVVSAAVTGWQTPAQAGAVDGATYRYRAYSSDLTEWEIGTGTYTVSSTTLTRTVTASSNAGSAVNFTSAPQVALTSFGADISSSVEITGGTVSGLSSLSVSGALTASRAGTPATFINTTDGAFVEALRIEGDRATPANNDSVTQGFYLSDSGGTQTLAARVTASAANVTAGAMTSAMYFALTVAGTHASRMQLSSTILAPFTNDGLALGNGATSWSDLYLASGGVVNWNNGDVTVTHSTNALAFAGASSGYSFDANVATTGTFTKNGNDVTVLSITFIIDGGGSAITTGEKGDLTIPFACTINEWTLLADQSGDIVVDIWKDTYANYPPTVADTITASAKPTISASTKGQSSTLTGWTTSIAAGDVLAFNVDSAATVTRVTLSLKVTRA